MAQTAVGRIKIDPKIRQQHLENCRLSDIYSKAGSVKSKNVRAERQRLSQAAVDAALARAACERTEYQARAEIGEMVKAVRHVLQDLMQYMQVGEGGAASGWVRSRA